MSPPTNSSAPGFAKQQRGERPVADFDRRLLVRWAVDAAEGVCLLFCALGGELFLNPPCLASPRAVLRIRSDFQKSLVRRQAGPGFLAGMFAGRQE